MRAVVESFSFAIDPWNAGKVAAERRKRGMAPLVDNGGNLFEQISYVTRDNRLALPNAVRPKPSAAR